MSIIPFWNILQGWQKHLVKSEAKPFTNWKEKLILKNIKGEDFKDKASKI